MFPCNVWCWKHLERRITPLHVDWNCCPNLNTVFVVNDALNQSLIQMDSCDFLLLFAKSELHYMHFKKSKVCLFSAWFCTCWHVAERGILIRADAPCESNCVSICWFLRWRKMNGLSGMWIVQQKQNEEWWIINSNECSERLEHGWL